LHPVGGVAQLYWVGLGWPPDPTAHAATQRARSVRDIPQLIAREGFRWIMTPDERL
jgi:hypothetical protein